MPLIPLLPLFHFFNREHFNGSLTIKSRPLLSVRWSDGRLRKTAGLYRRGPGIGGKYGAEIVLSRPLLESLPQLATQSTLCHEMIHAWIDLVLQVQEGHGPNFHSQMNVINTSQDKFQVSVRHKFPVPITSPRWWAVCANCARRFPYKRLVRGAACRHCCQMHSGGFWDASYLLTYEPASKEI